jgi:hypothetical protein
MVPVVMVSSTAIDLRECREQVQHACMRLGVHPMLDRGWRKSSQP